MWFRNKYYADFGFGEYKNSEMGVPHIQLRELCRDVLQQIYDYIDIDELPW